MDIKKLSRITDSIEKETTSRFWDNDQHMRIHRPVRLGDYVRWKDLEVGKEYYFRYGRAFDNNVAHIKVYLKDDTHLVGLLIPQFSKAPKWARDIVKDHTDIDWYFKHRESEEDDELMKDILKELRVEGKNAHTVDKYHNFDVLHEIDDWVEFFVKDPSRESIKDYWGYGHTGKFYEVEPLG